MREEHDRRAELALVEEAEGPLEVFDTILSQLRGLIQSRHPAGTLSAMELNSLTGEHLRGIPADEDGVWAYYPWSRRLVHLLDEQEFVELHTNRNRYRITPAELAELSAKKLVMVGLSVGQSVAAVLALERCFSELRLADFDLVDLSNFHRIRTGVHASGIPKVYVTARDIADIEFVLKLAPFSKGITGKKLDALLLQSGKLDTVVEECDSIDTKILVRDRARFHRIPQVMDTSDRGMLDIERFDLEPKRPLFHGLAGDLQPGELRNLATQENVRYVMRILGAHSLSPRLRASLLELAATLAAARIQRFSRSGSRSRRPAPDCFGSKSPIGTVLRRSRGYHGVECSPLRHNYEFSRRQDSHNRTEGRTCG